MLLGDSRAFAALTSNKNAAGIGENRSADGIFDLNYRLIAVAGTPIARAGIFFARTARFHRLGCIDGQIATVVVVTMERIDGLLALFGVAHGDETKAARAIGFTIHDEVGFGDSAVLSEELVQVLFSGLEGKISHV
jgi:hypothetical protein